ncbi:MAG: hypothetical protein UZ03_NOB001002366 [Nitrospira sp. OLB3]|nr:MAG: hypothetical protein UZ03_NOB001002366 [Nitrospira sp. OLB3]
MMSTDLAALATDNERKSAQMQNNGHTKEVYGQKISPGICEETRRSQPAPKH